MSVATNETVESTTGSDDAAGQLPLDRSESVARETVARETWRPIPSAPDYQVSDWGRVRSPSGKLIGSTNHPRGYPRVSISGHRVVLVHQLVAEAFLGPAEGRRVRHVDTSDPSNNRLDNLVYGL